MALQRTSGCLVHFLPRLVSSGLANKQEIFSGRASFCSAAPSEVKVRTELSLDELCVILDGATTIVDVRNPQEIQKSGQIPGSVNIPLNCLKEALLLSEDDWSRQFRSQKPRKDDRSLVFYGRGPNASSTAVEIAHRIGFRGARNYKGGWDEYSQKLEGSRGQQTHSFFDKQHFDATSSLTYL